MRGCGLVGAAAAVGLGGDTEGTEGLWGEERGGRETMGDAACAVGPEVRVRSREAVRSVAVGWEAAGGCCGL